ncbi:MAG: ParB N-terminal domain-containing protein [Defluviitaleaceae bacterium]|nr:ParB N-terminal domain-containing protein [Defluviitaleaceae bacterium]
MARTRTLVKPKLKSIDDMFKFDENAKNVVSVMLDELIHYRGSGNVENGFQSHPFTLYSGERLDDMVESIVKNGVITPIIVRRVVSPGGNGSILEILAGHNRTEAAKLAGLAEIPAIIYENVPDEVAEAYVVETNLMQRSFSDMKHSEKALVIATCFDRLFSSRKRKEIKDELNEPTTQDVPAAIDKGVRTDTKVAEAYGLSRATVARYVRINTLNKGLITCLDKGFMPFLAAYEATFLTPSVQNTLYIAMTQVSPLTDEHYAIPVTVKHINVLRTHCIEQGEPSMMTITSILSNAYGKLVEDESIAEIKPRKIKLKGDIYNKYFKDYNDEKEVGDVIEEALQYYFSHRRANQS